MSDLLRAFPAEQMTAYPVSTRVNAVTNGGADRGEQIPAFNEQAMQIGEYSFRNARHIEHPRRPYVETGS